MFKRILSLALCLCFGLSIAWAETPVTVPDIANLTRRDVPDNAAMAFVKDMKIGWNLGNTFDANTDGTFSKDMELESYWCGVKTTEAMIEAICQAGFKTIRMPVSWHNHVDENFTINTPWLDRVQEVVDWAMERDMYVILNTHHDVYPEYYYPDEAHYETSCRYITSIWTQLADRFKDYGDHLIFENMNEPRLKDTDVEWWFNQNDPRCVESAECINKLNQAFVDTVRAAGGQNAGRYLMVSGYDASPESALNTDFFRLPTDTADNKIIVSVHAYTPYDFALNEKGTDDFDLTLASHTSAVHSFLHKLYTTYVANGVPVVVGEFGARAKNGNLQDRVDFATLYIAAASIRNIPCLWWDNNAFKGSGELFGIFDRKNLSWPYPEIVEGLMKYAGYDAMPAAQE